MLHPKLGDICQLCAAWRGAFGLEPTIEMYVEHSIEVLREIRRVLRPDGVCFWNIGDGYSGNPNSGGKNENNGGQPYRISGIRAKTGASLKPKDLCLIPARVALAAQADGWWVRSDIIWAKPNPMPESVSGWRWEQHRIKIKSISKDDPRYRHGMAERGAAQSCTTATATEWADCPGCERCEANRGLVLRQGSWRPTDAYEHILMLTKSENYFCDAEAVRENLAESTLADKRNATGRHTQGSETYGVDPTSPDCPSWYRSKTFVNPESGRNLRNVWTFATQPYKGAHFATFPEELVRRCIAAGTSERGCCPECGAPWVRVVERTHEGKTIKTPKLDAAGVGPGLPRLGPSIKDESKTLGWRPTCHCIGHYARDSGWCAQPRTAASWMALADSIAPEFKPVPCVVLDPFAGSGTVGEVAYKMGRSAILIDLAYQDLQRERIPPMGRIAAGSR